MLATLLLAVLTAHTPVRVIPEADLARFWELAPERMGPTMPPLARSTHSILQRLGTVTVEFEITIDGSGIPGDYVLHRIDPPDTDPRPFMATELFMRYRATASNPDREPVRFRVNRRHHIPAAVPGLPGGDRK